MFSRLSSAARPLSRAAASVRAATPVTTATRALSSDAPLAKTALYDFHLEHGGKMVPFAGYELPVQYSTGVLKEHHHTRTDGCASLFDVSHMGQVRVEGPDAVAFVEHVTVADIRDKTSWDSALSVIPNATGGILDDTIVTKVDDNLVYMVVNGACKYKDMSHMLDVAETTGMDVKLEMDDDRQLLALQGDGAAAILDQLTPSEAQVAKQPFMRMASTTVDGVDCFVTRCGYTGEDGYEISVPSHAATHIANKLMSFESVMAAGLGARDSLRLEAGLCLYGNDLNETTSPVEGALLWTISKRRRAEASFVGADVILDQIKNGVTRKRVGFMVEGPPAREGAIVQNELGDEIGVVTSGTRSPVLGKNIGMAYVQKGSFKVGTPIKVQVRNKVSDGVVTKMPFVPARYYKP